MAGKPLPSNVRRLRGTLRKDRTNPNEPRPKADKITPPRGMSKPARKHWPDFVKMLQEAGIATNLDVVALEALCVVYARWREANAEVDKGGPLAMTPNGFPVQSPWIQISSKAFDQMSKMLSEFGMTPSSRTRVTASKPPEANPFDAV